jgi:diacylglycerol kinase (ATP)
VPVTITGRRGPASLKICFILNPRSGHLRRQPETIRLIRDYVARRPGEAELCHTTHPGHAVELAAAAVRSNCGLIVAVGGDGTMNEVARALLGTPAALGLVPCGSGNGLARHLGIPLQPAAALALLDRPAIRSIDAGRINDRPFFCVAGTGFEAHLTALFNQRQQRGFLGYLLLAVREYWRYAPRTYGVTHPGTAPRPVPALTLAFANTAQYGNNAFIAPRAQVDDGQLELVAIPPFGLWRGPGLAWRLFRGTLDHDATVHRQTAAAFTVTAAAPMEFHTDGESHPPAATLTVTILPGALRVAVPR